MASEPLDHGDGEQLTIEPLAVDAAGVARLFSVGLRSIRRWDSSGKLPRGYSIGKRKLWRVNDLRAWAAAGFPDRRTFAAREVTR